MTDFLTSYGPLVALACAGTAVLYGTLITQRLLGLSPGNEQMQEISGAVQEGARAYLTRQYTIIAGVAIVLALALIPLQNYKTAIGFVIGAAFSGAAGFIGMNLSVRANSRVAEAARGGVPPALDAAFKGGSVTGMLVVGLALLGVAGYYGILVTTGSSDKEAVDALIGLERPRVKRERRGRRNAPGFAHFGRRAAGWIVDIPPHHVLDQQRPLPHPHLGDGILQLLADRDHDLRLVHHLALGPGEQGP